MMTSEGRQTRTGEKIKKPTTGTNLVPGNILLPAEERLFCGARAGFLLETKGNGVSYLA